MSVVFHCVVDGVVRNIAVCTECTRCNRVQTLLGTSAHKRKLSWAMGEEHVWNYSGCDCQQGTLRDRVQPTVNGVPVPVVRVEPGPVQVPAPPPEPAPPPPPTLTDTELRFSLLELE